MMSNREAPSRSRLRPTAPPPDQVLTRLGRGTPNATTVVQNSGSFRPIQIKSNPTSNVESDANSLVDINPIIHFDAEQYRTEIKKHSDDEKRLEQLVLNAIQYFLNTLKRSAPQQMVDYTVLTFLAWTVSIHSEIFRLSSVLRAMYSLLKGLNISKVPRTFPTTPYTLVCQILWIAFKDQTLWPEEFIEAYVEDALGEQNWIKNADCHLFVSNIRTAFHTRTRTWKIDQIKFAGSMPISSTISLNNTDETSNDSNTPMSIGNDSNPADSSDMTTSNADETTMINTSDQKLIYPRYEGRSQAIQQLLQTWLTGNPKLKSLTGPGVILNNVSSTSIGSTTNTSTSATVGTSQPYETEKLLSLLEHICGLPDIRLYILSRLDIWLQNSKLKHTAEKLMITLCENLTKRSTHSHPCSNGYANNSYNNNNNNNSNHQQHSDLSYIDERAIEQLVNLRFKALVSNQINKTYISCIREMIKHDVNLVDILVRFIVHNELQQLSPNTSVTPLNNGKNSNNLPLLHACFQAQPELTCQALAMAIQNILLSTNMSMGSKDYDNLLRLIRPFLRELARIAKQEFDPMRFCMCLVDVHYSSNLQSQFWTLMQQMNSSLNDPTSLSNEITSYRLLKRLLECDMIIRERFLYAICDLIPMMILVSAQAFHSQTTSSTNLNNANRTPSTLSSIYNYEQWLAFIQRISLIQCSSCLFYLLTLQHLFDPNSTINSTPYVPCLYSLLFTVPVNSYLRIENWPSDESVSLRNELFRLSSEIPLLGETFFLLVRIGLTPQFRSNTLIIIDLIDINVRRTLNVEQKMSNETLSNYLRCPDDQCQLFLRTLFDLTRYHVPKTVQFPGNYEIPQNLSITDLFWKTCLTTLLLASHDPQIIGRFIWFEVPQIRLFMEMLLTGDYTYPPRSMIESKNYLEKFYMNERVSLREEKDLVLELEKYLASPQMIDESNSQLLGKVMVFNFQQIRRAVTQEKSEKDFYNLIQALNNSYKLSSMLCRCRTPDFILDILNRKDKQEKFLFDGQISWLTGLIDSNIDCLNVFPILCLCDYFQHMILTCASKQRKSIQSRKTLSALDTIRIRFQTIFQQTKSSEQTTGNDLICILNYFFNCLNSNLCSMRSNAWLCLYIIVIHHPSTSNMEYFLNQSNCSTDSNIQMILDRISQLRSFEQIQSSLKQTLAETCQFETNLFLLHSSIVFILEHFQSTSNFDQQLLVKLARELIRRHSILYLLIQYDRDEKNFQLIERFFQRIGRILLEKLRETVEKPIQLTIDGEHDEQMSSETRTYLVLSKISNEQVDLLRQMEKHLKISSTFAWSSDSNRHYIQVDSILIEFLLIFLASFHLKSADQKAIESFAFVLQEFLLNRHSLPSLMTIKEYQRPVPVKQDERERSESPDSEECHFKQFAVDDNEPIRNHRKRRLELKTATDKVFLSSSISKIYRPVMINNQYEQSLFQSDDVQYFLFKSANLTLVQQCIDQASLATCLKMFRISGLSSENINYLCQRLIQLFDQSSKQMQTSLKQSSLIVPILNRWIIEGVPNAIVLGEKLQKILEKRNKKSHGFVHSVSLIATSSRQTSSISEQIHQFHRQINAVTEEKLDNEQFDSNRMETSDITLQLPWKDLNECDEFLKRLLDKKFDPIKRRQFLIELQWLIHQSDEHRRQLFQTIFQRCGSNDVKKFINQLNEQSNTSNVLLGVLIKKRHFFSEDSKKLIKTFRFYETQGKSLFSMKIKEFQRLIDQSTSFSTRREQSSTTITVNEILHVLSNYFPLRDCQMERNFLRYFRSSSINAGESQRVLIDVLIEAEDRLSGSTIGMILDQLEKIDYQSSTTTTIDVYANRSLFSQRNRSSISQRLLLKQFLHSCSWSTILQCIDDLLMLPRTLNSSIDQRDSILILDMFEAFLKLSPLWSGREYKMLERCHDEFLFPIERKHIASLFIYIIDEASRLGLTGENLCQQYQKRYETILYPLMKISSTRIDFERCLEELFIDASNQSWMKDYLPFYLIVYLNQPDLFAEHFDFILPNLFSGKDFLCTASNSILHDLFIRLNNYENLSQENFSQVVRLLKFYVSQHPYLVLRHLKMIKTSFQSRLATFHLDDFHRRNSNERTYFFALFDLIRRLKPHIYDQIYEDDLQNLMEIYLRFLTNQFNAFYHHSHEFLQFLDDLLRFLFNYFSSTRNHLVLKMFQTKFFEKITEKIQSNNEFQQTLVKHHQYQILYHLNQFQILNEAVKNDETRAFDVRLALIDRSATKSFDIQHYRRKFSLPIDETSSTAMIDELVRLLNELKLNITLYFTEDHLTLIIDSLTKYLLDAPKRLMEETYDFILKYIDRYPQNASIFYSIYVKCLLSPNLLVFQLALKHFSHLIIYFQRNSNELFALLLKQALINKIDVTLTLTQAIRLLNLHRYDPITTNIVPSTKTD